jgi:hypothetical protein
MRVEGGFAKDISGMRRHDMKEHAEKLPRLLAKRRRSSSNSRGLCFRYAKRRLDYEDYHVLCQDKLRRGHFAENFIGERPKITDCFVDTDRMAADSSVRWT